MKTKIGRVRLNPVGCVIAALAGAGFVYTLASIDFDLYPEDIPFGLPLILFGVCLAVGLVITLTQDEEEAVIRDPDWLRGGLLLGALIAYAGLIPVLGFPLTTFLFQITLVAGVFEKRSVLWLIALPTGLTLTLCIAFDRLLLVPLPRGTGIFYSLSGWII